MVGFFQWLRNNEFKIGIQSSKDSLDVLLQGLSFDHKYLEPSLAALFCHGPKDLKKFTIIYKRFWKEKGTRLTSASDYHNKKKVHKSAKSSTVMMGVGKDNREGEVEESKNTSGASGKETLKQTDFSKLTVVQSQELDEIAEKLVKDMHLRIKRRRKKSKKGDISIQKTIHRNIQNGGNLINLYKVKRTKEKFRLLILLDVSGSMDKYSYYLLKFLWALRTHFKHVEVFAFSTIIKRITAELQDQNIAYALAQVSQVATHWSSGTKIGNSLKYFNDHHARYHLNGKTLTLVMSDGLDTGETEVLEEAIRKIKMKSKRLIWLNPLKGMKGYEPIQKGMKTVLPEVNHFGSAHNMASLLELENILINA